MSVVEQLIADWVARHPGRGGVDLVELVEAAIEAGRAPVRRARDAYASKVERLKAELEATCNELEQLDAYREQAATFAVALVEFGHADIVDRELVKAAS